jgi:serine/threonine protein kinase
MSDPNLIVTFIAPEPARIAPLFPGYGIEYLIATGGMGAVYKAVQLSLDRPEAIKILPREFGEDESFRTSFEAEAKAMARLNHPNLIGVYDFGEVAGMPFIVMEFVPGKTLFHSAHGIAIAADEAARIVTDVCLGLAHAHEHGILHRDIKPGNILLDQQARPKIGDFGLARPIGTAVRDGETIFGTPHYTAPEVLKYPNSVGVRADIFSVGVVLHELLTGRLPAADPRPPSVICGCDHRFDAIIRRATHPSPDLRYTSAAEMAKDLGAITHAFAGQNAKLRTTAPSGTLPAPIRRISSANPDSANGMLILAGMAVAAALVAALFIVLKKQEPPSVGPAPTSSPPSAPAPTPPPPPPNNRPADPKPIPAPVTVERKPDPIPEAEPEPEPEPEPEVAKTEPEPEVVKPAPAPAPTFDVPDFLERARGIMRQKANPIFAAHDKDIEKNYESFERRVKREIRRLDKARKPFVEPLAEASFEEWRKNGKRLPKTLEAPGAKDGNQPVGLRGGGKDEDKGFFKEFRSIHADFLVKQGKLDQKLELSLLELASTYILGLTKQMEKLSDPVERPSVALLQDEVRATQDRADYFSDLMHGIDPNVAAKADDAANAGAKGANEKRPN